jgi:signal transduction histidine kinase
VAEAVANLVTNAVRHSGAQEVRVTAARARVVVEDRGVGIPPEHAARIFERFYRVDPARAAESGGAGLGLAIVRRIARLHGGEVTFEPVRPHGARFVLTLGEK